jgi:ribosomal-protein-alanine N-acetyltransferase
LNGSVAYTVPERSGRHPGWPARLGSLRVRAGVVALRPIWLRDGPAWSAIRLRSQAHLEPWEPTAPGPWALRNAPAEWPGRWLQMRAAGRRGVALPFAVTLDGALAGHVIAGNVTREPLLSAYVGYWCDARLAGGGITTAAVAMVVDHCFGPVGLHRLEATVRPTNAASRRVLAKLGFREEGLLQRYLDVDGAWRDHLLYGITAEEQPAGGFVRRIVDAGFAERG